MKISAIRIAGFRGIRSTIELRVPTGFLILTGRNGTGKSTFCDAIEYALSGNIRPNSDRTERGESFIDYLWWRGEGKSTDHYVSLCFVDEEGTEIEVKRTPDALSIIPDSYGSVEDLLCDATIAPSDSLRQLCRTTIFRDEEITQLSMNLPETERFELVRQALGTTGFSEIETKLKSVQEIFKERSDELKGEYNSIREKVSGIAIRIREEKAEVMRVERIGLAEQELRDLLDLRISDTSKLLNTARDAVAELRYETDTLTQLVDKIEVANKRRKEIETAAFLKELQNLQKLKDELGKKLIEINNELMSLDEEIGKQKDKQPRLTSVAQLLEHGRALGLDDGQCPLCGSEISEMNYNKHLLELEKIIITSSEKLSTLVGKRRSIVKDKEALQNNMESTKRNMENLASAAAFLDREMSQLQKEAESFHIKVTLDKYLDSSLLVEYIEKNRDKAKKIDQGLAALESSRALERIDTLEKEKVIVEQQTKEIEKRLNRVGIASQHSKSALDILRRVRGDVIDDRLAELTPLIDELYLRLRPHENWQHMKYHLRGDVRRFLSFQVGDKLNPSFIFSSGQLRVTGLSFLLAVSLSRGWCRLKTLILDDPVQHIDDFRALQLTEVLGAIRQSGYQIICTAEEISLAQLLTRRLRSREGSEGKIVQLNHNSESGIYIDSDDLIQPMPRQVLLKT